VSTDQPTTADLEELRRLRRENAELRRANEILKAASSAFFASEIGRPCGPGEVHRPARRPHPGGTALAYRGTTLGRRT
jgi:transposase-like protein